MLIIAHRGASHDAPENTLAAARLGWEQGADALEVDVHLTRDGRLAVIHDSDTQRTAGIPGEVGSLTLAELQSRDVGRWKSPRFAGERIPALEAILADVPAGKRLFVELKGGPASVPALQQAITQGVRAASLPRSQITIIAFDLATARAAKRALPENEVCWLADAGDEAPCPTIAEVARVAREAGLDGIDVAADWELDVECVQQIRQGGFKLYVWTVDDAPLARRLAATGIDGLTTNRPGWLRVALGGVKG